MIQKSLLVPKLKRELKPPFAWVDRRFMFDGFFAALTPCEILLYFFLILVADRDGLSFYSYDKICQLLKIDVDTYIKARNGLIQKKLIAFDNTMFQVLALPQRQKHKYTAQPPANLKQDDFQDIASIFKQLNNQ